MSRQLYINERLLDLSDDQPIALSYQVNDIAELADRQANYSNKFIVPDTNNNSVVLNFSSQVNSNTLTPYRKVSSTYIENGIPRITNGVAIIDSFQNGVGYEITLYSGISDFFSQIGDKTLKDIDWSNLNHAYNLSDILNINNLRRQELYILSWPLINWGTYPAGYNADTEPKVDIRYLQPCVDFKYILDRIFGLTTYSASGEILSDSIIHDMIMTLSPDQQNDDDATLLARSFYGTLSFPLTDAGIVQSSSGPTIANLFAYFQNTSSPGYTTNCVYIDNTGRTIVPYPDSWVPPQTLTETKYISNSYTTVEISVKITFNSMTSTGFEDYRIFKNNRLVNFVPLYGGNHGHVDNFVFQNTFTIDLKPGDQIKMQLRATSYIVNIVSLDNNFIEIKAISTSPIFGQLNYNYLMPDYKLKDIIRTFAQMFCLIISTSKDGKEIIFTKFKQIKENLSGAEDWSNKIDFSNENLLSYRIGNYGQQNNIKYADDDFTNGVGNSSFQINDTTLVESLDLFEFIYPSALQMDNIYTTKIQFNRLPVDDYKIFGRSENLWIYNKAYPLVSVVGHNGLIYYNIQVIPANSYIDISDYTYWKLREDQYVSFGPNRGVTIPRYTLIKADPWDVTQDYSNGDLVNYGNKIWTRTSESDDHLPPGSTLPIGPWELKNIQYEQTVSSSSRLLLLKWLNPSYVPGSIGDANETIVTITDGISNVNVFAKSIPVGYFSDINMPYELTAQDLIKNYYQEVINMLSYAKINNCRIRLTDIDISNIDFLTLKYIRHFGNYFYLNKIDEYIQGQSANCQLIRM